MVPSRVPALEFFGARLARADGGSELGQAQLRVCGMSSRGMCSPECRALLCWCTAAARRPSAYRVTIHSGSCTVSCTNASCAVIKSSILTPCVERTRRRITPQFYFGHDGRTHRTVAGTQIRFLHSHSRFSNISSERRANHLSERIDTNTMS